MIERGTAAFWRTNAGLFAAGLATFALLYCVQPLMPLFTGVFHIDPAQSALTLSVTTMPLAFAMLVASGVSEALGRKPVMVASLLASSILAVLCAFAPGFGWLLLLRGLMGLTLSGLPAVAMAYVAEEMHPSAAGLGMGLYIGGSAIGGLSGRLLSGAVADMSSWRAALAAIGMEGVACGLLLWRGLPASAHFEARPLHPRALLGSYAAHLRRPVLPWLFLEGFLLMGGFVTLYNFIGYRLMGPPYRLSQTEVGLIFCVYLTGVASSPVMGNLAMRVGQRVVMVGNIAVMLAGGGADAGRAPARHRRRGGAADGGVFGGPFGGEQLGGVQGDGGAGPSVGAVSLRLLCGVEHRGICGRVRVPARWLAGDLRAGGGVAGAGGDHSAAIAEAGITAWRAWPSNRSSIVSIQPLRLSPSSSSATALTHRAHWKAPKTA